MEHPTAVDRAPVCSCYRDSKYLSLAEQSEIFTLPQVPVYPSAQAECKIERATRLCWQTRYSASNSPRTADIPRTNPPLGSFQQLSSNKRSLRSKALSYTFDRQRTLRRCCTAGCARRCSAALFPATGRAALKLSNNGTDVIAIVQAQFPCAMRAVGVCNNLRHRNLIATDQWAQDMFAVASCANAQRQ